MYLIDWQTIFLNNICVKAADEIRYLLLTTTFCGYIKNIENIFLSVFTGKKIFSTIVLGKTDDFIIQFFVPI